MKLAPLLATSSEEDLARLSSEHLRIEEQMARPQLCNFLESAISSYRFVQDFLVGRQPPTFAMLSTLLDSPGFELSRDELEHVSLKETQRIATLVDSGELLARDEQLRLYRCALKEARRTDCDINGSESAILGALRQASHIAHIEHYLIEHHSDLREFWEKDDCFSHEENALKSAGLIFLRDGKILIPEDVVAAVSQALGIEMPTDSLRRLLGYLSSSDLATALAGAGSRLGGSREMRLERLIVERVQPRAILKEVDGETLRSICRETGASVSGRRDELIERIVEHFSQRRDQAVEEAPVPPRIEPRSLALGQFQTLFGFLQHQELSDILRRFPDLKQTGTKETKISTLWEAHLSENTLLSELMNRDLENILYRLGLRLAGAKHDRLARIIQHFSNSEASSAVNDDTTVVDASAVASNPNQFRDAQEAFRQKASNPTASLQPWINELLGASGLVRCYATEDATPTKQLKNKLAQAASANGGLLVLLVNDREAFEKSREALVERWMANDEWSKSVACVALAYPLRSAAIHVVISNRTNEWSTRIKEGLFPEAELTYAFGAPIGQPVCLQCGGLLPALGKFCPDCGAKRT